MKTWLMLGAVAAISALPQSGFSSGFALIEQSVSAMGTAYAGAAATAEDASTIYFNPAGMSKLCWTDAVSGMHVVLPSAKFHNAGSVDFQGNPLTGGNGGDAGVEGFVPHLYLSAPLKKGFTAGLGINAPFGLSTEYQKNWVGRYHAITSELLTININPSVAYRISPCLSIGVGFSAMYLDAKLTNAVDFGGVVGAPQSQDGEARLKGDSWGYGANAGILWDISSSTRIGASYRTRMKHSVSGSIKYSGVPESLEGIFQDAVAKSRVTLPSLACLSLVHCLDPSLALVGDFSWTSWSCLKDLRFRFRSPQPTNVTTLDWKDSWRLSAGAIYQPLNCLTLRTGFALDKTPIPNASHRTPRIPDQDRWWLTFGVNYCSYDWLRFDFGYAYLFVREPEIRKSAEGEDLFRGALRGSYDAYTQIVSAQAHLLF